MRLEDAITDPVVIGLYLAMLAGRDRSGYFELRCKAARGMRQEWFSLEDRPAAAARIVELGTSTDVYVGVLPRHERAGGSDALGQAWALFVDLDDAEQGAAALAGFDPWPHVVIRSGRGLHAYWSLREPLDARHVRQANRRLAHHLGADMNATDAARILRPPGTLNHKYAPPRRVECVRLDLGPAFTAQEVVGALPDPPAPAPDRTLTRLRARRAGGAFGDPLDAIPAAEYVPLLLGRELGRDGKVTCPFHGGGQERTPSLHVYGEERGWACFSCPPAPWQRGGADHLGGRIIDLGAMLYGLEPRGRGYHEIRRRLAADLLGATEEAA